jgi:hypothetical protein
MPPDTQGGTKAKTAHGATRPFAPWAVVFVALTQSTVASARPPRDAFLDPAPIGRRLLLMPFFGPGFRTAYDQRVEIEPDMSDLRAQLVGTVAVPFAETSAQIDVRFFLMTFGATAGFHDEWHLLRFHPDPETGRDRAGQPPTAEPPAASLPPGARGLPVDAEPATAFHDLDRGARNAKDENADVDHASYPFLEARWGFYWPGYGFMGASTLAARWDARPDVSYDWENATVQSRGVAYRWEGYFLFRERNTGFIGPALRALVVPRNRVVGEPTIGSHRVVVPAGSACQMDEAVVCRRTHEPELAYGLLAGMSPGFGHGEDALLVRIYAAFGLREPLFGTHLFRAPIQIQVAYQAYVEL